MKISDTNKTIDLLESIDSNDEYAYERAILAFLKLGGLPVFINELPADLTFFSHKNA